MKNETTRRFGAIVLACGAACIGLTVLSACNTVEGAAEDVKGAGKATVDTTEKVFSSEDD